MTVGSLIEQVKLFAIPGDVVRVERGAEEFTDTISGVEIIFQDSKWCATYWFREHDDEAKEFHIKEIVAKIRTIHPIPKPKYDFDQYLKFKWSWDKDAIEQVAKCKWIRIWLSDEDMIRYHFDPPLDWADEDEVICRLEEVHDVRNQDNPDERRI